MLCDKFPVNNVLRIRFDKKSGSRIEHLDVENDRKSPHAKIIEEMQRYINEDFGPTPDSMQGNIRKVFEVVLKTKSDTIRVYILTAKNLTCRLHQVAFLIWVSETQYNYSNV
jgi:hypothetical protein